MMGALVQEANPVAAAQALSRAVDEYQTTGRLDKAAITLIALGEAYERGGDDRRALEAYERADGLLEQLRGLLAADVTRIGIRGSFEKLYDRLILLYARDPGRADAERVWHWVERAKARALVELIGVSPIPPGAGADAPATQRLLADEEALLAVLRRARLGQGGALGTDMGQDTEALDGPHEAVARTCSCASSGNSWHLSCPNT